jgi:4-hydroxy-3-methylbut-2-enyl diphosphate reductase
MLSTESLEIGERFRHAMRDRHGETALPDRFRSFDTICSATQDRQDAVLALLAEQRLDLMIVLGGYNSSNTQALTAMCAARVPTFHVDRAECIEPSLVRHRPVRGGTETATRDWLPEGDVTVGLTAGASTPDSVVGLVVERLLAARGHAAAELMTA